MWVDTLSSSLALQGPHRCGLALQLGGGGLLANHLVTSPQNEISPIFYFLKQNLASFANMNSEQTSVQRALRNRNYSLSHASGLFPPPLCFKSIMSSNFGLLAAAMCGPIILFLLLCLLLLCISHNSYFFKKRPRTNSIK